ncbi:hypothetical protein JL37_04025 [Achromobacter sp. RTa]|uniref:hypothetical protein n=1 Tax=Achromobacter sp. RTa TaxID=1532557 RepID=UPI00050DDC32|nr:hypothetical protein [Achromobacter sp. RTa]KGD99738.1 hypothetical protein JL37_04025 [Achromobacter sp. RTa]
MSITYRPPFDEDDERDLRALYRRPGPGSSPELDAAVRRSWHPGHSWHPAWGAAACAAMVIGLFAWTDMREAQQDLADQAAQLIAPHESASSPDRSAAPPVQAEAPAAQPSPAALREAAPQGDASPPQAVPAQEAAPAAGQQAAETPQGEAAAEQTAPFSEQDIDARVAHIRSLMQADQQDDAVQALRELQEGAPDLALPDDLQELADQNPA